MRLKYEPSSEPLHISAKKLFSDRELFLTVLLRVILRVFDSAVLTQKGFARVVDDETEGTPPVLFLDELSKYQLCSVVFAHERAPLRSYRGTSPIRNSAPRGPYSNNMPGDLWWSYGGGGGVMSDIPL